MQCGDDKKIFNPDLRGICAKNRVEELALVIGVIFIVFGIFTPVALIAGAIIFTGGVIATAIKSPR